MERDRPRLNRRLLHERHFDESTLDLPEKVIQFGTGAFLRGFVEYFIDEANRAGRFDGRIVAVGSTGSGRDRKLNEQDGLYTLARRGVENGVVRHDYQLITSVSRALSASHQWQTVLASAREPQMALIFSNTTEAGIKLDESDKLGPGAPRSFPGKLTGFLLERARHFDYERERGLVVLPCELIEDNGDRLRDIVIALSRRWSLGDEFERWLEDAVVFCNTLVDRIVPGELEGADLAAAWEEIGYRDELVTVCEPYFLYAIQGDDALARRLRFAVSQPNIIVTSDITPYRRRKLRLLNATHSILAPTAMLAGRKTVADAMADEQIGAYVRRVLFTELVPASGASNAEAYANQVLDRFSNPHVRHALLDITLQQTAKLRVRIIPAIVDFSQQTSSVPEAIALGFAAYLLYVREARSNERPDDQADVVRSAWRSAGAQLPAVAQMVCDDKTLWGDALTHVPAFARRVGDYLELMATAGVRAALDELLAVPQRA